MYVNTNQIFILKITNVSNEPIYFYIYAVNPTINTDKFKQDVQQVFNKILRKYNRKSVYELFRYHNSNQIFNEFMINLHLLGYRLIDFKDRMINLEEVL